MTNLNNAATIQEWLIDRLSSSLKVPKTSLDPDAPFSRYALDSLDAVTLVMDLEEQLGTELPATLLWDYPTVHKCVAYLLATREELVQPVAGS